MIMIKNRQSLLICIILALLILCISSCSSSDQDNNTDAVVEHSYRQVEDDVLEFSGGFYDESGFFRLPKELTVSEDVDRLAKNSAGGRIRLQTDASSIIIDIKLEAIPMLPYFSTLDTAGLDVYIGEGAERRWHYNIYPNNLSETKYTRTITFDSQVMRDVAINLPTYATVLDIGFQVPEDAQVKRPKPYAIENPIVFYGSSITQGCAASRPGLNYPAIVTRAFDANMLNLGFSGSAKGELAMAEYISKGN